MGTSVPSVSLKGQLGLSAEGAKTLLMANGEVKNDGILKKTCSVFIFDHLQSVQNCSI